MGGRISSHEVAVWLRVQIAAGRLSGRSDFTETARLAERLQVPEEIVSGAYALLRDQTRIGASDPAVPRHKDFRAIADLVDQIASHMTARSDRPIRRATEFE